MCVEVSSKPKSKCGGNSNCGCGGHGHAKAVALSPRNIRTIQIGNEAGRGGYSGRHAVARHQAYVPHYDNYPVTRCGWLDTVPDVPVVADARFERTDLSA